MFYAPEPTHTLATLDEMLPPTPVTSLINVRSMEVNLGANDGDRSIRWQTPEGGRHEVPISTEGLNHLSDRLGVPWKFLERQDDDFRQLVLSELIARQDPTAQEVIRYNDLGVLGIMGIGAQTIPFERLIDAIRSVMPDESPVMNVVLDADNFGFDAIVPEGFSSGWGGDPDAEIVDRHGDRKVGDLTAGGLRLLYPHAKRHAPRLNGFQHRLVCTNGMSSLKSDLAIDARGLTVDEMLNHLEEMARISFGRVEDEIASFYAMREDRVDNPERTLLRLGGEHGLSSSVATELAMGVASIDDPTMFDLINLITNAANDPRRKPRAARALQAAAGAIVTEHAARCGSCQSRLV